VTDAVDAHKYSVGDRVEAEFVERVSVVGCVGCVWVGGAATLWPVWQWCDHPPYLLLLD